ncbi:nucleotide exchange factor GrpE [Gracilibacillus alcaliphilus]|uniref:nucleotide exchange factor GrpE n=1 Tax=Gracilibacillus alcaliphilus TaxID=1401441 RepID=UPI001957309C|nr:molecular chaperone GrpE [Gracilibacillus alcaliphilus]
MTENKTQEEQEFKQDETTAEPELDQEQETVTDEQGNEPEQETQEQEIVEDPFSSEEYEQLQQEKNELHNRLLRLQAEYDNFRKRTQKEKQATLKYSSQAVVTELLPVLDNFERALQVKIEDPAAKGVVEGLEMVYRQLKTVLENEEVTEIDTSGEFDPNLHQAVMQVNEEGYESNQIVETMQKGYLLKDRVIRPAMVKVNQ